jgi:TRAP-type uncharacterized transport system substrate-binding protein
MMTPAVYIKRGWVRLREVVGADLASAISVAICVALAAGLAVLALTNFSVPDTIIMTSGPKGSSFDRNAEKYRQILARDGITLKILPSDGSVQNFKRLNDPKFKVDIGFVLGGEAGTQDVSKLMSLGSVSYQPLMIYYRGKPRTSLAEFKGMRLDIGEEGSGTRALALSLLKFNDIEPGDGTQFIDAKGDLVKALLSNRVDVLFVMGDSTSRDMMRELMHAEQIRLFDVNQADAYTRRIPHLNKLVLPRGALDFAKDTPSEDINLIGPTVEIVARENLHPALSDLLIAAAREVHGTPGLFKKRGEFPSAQERDFRMSEDALRFYTSGKSFLYRTFPFNVASMIARVLAFLVPILLLLVPAFRVLPAIYRWRIESRIHRWYKVLLELERDAFQPGCDPARREELLRHLDMIENSVSKVVIPAAFGDLFYGLRGHIVFVRNLLLSQQGQPKAASPAAA